MMSKYIWFYKPIKTDQADAIQIASLDNEKHSLRAKQRVGVVIIKINGPVAQIRFATGPFIYQSI